MDEQVHESVPVPLHETQRVHTEVAVATVPYGKPPYFLSSVFNFSGCNSNYGKPDNFVTDE